MRRLLGWGWWKLNGPVRYWKLIKERRKEGGMEEVLEEGVLDPKRAAVLDFEDAKVEMRELRAGGVGV